MARTTQNRRFPTAMERRIAMREELSDPRHAFGIGAANGSGRRPNPRGGTIVRAAPGDNCNPTGGGAPINEHCYRTGQRLCDMQHVGGALLNQAANAAFGPIIIVPTNTAYFEPVAAEVVVSQNANPNANSRVRFTAVTIGQSPQEPIDNRAPVVGTLAFFWSDHFLPNDYGPRPVSWGIFSLAAQAKDLQIWGFNPNAVAVDICWMIYGNAMDNLPPSRKAGQPFI